MTTFGDEMRRLMAEQGVSLRGLAKRVHYDVGYLSKVANGRKPPSVELATALDAALGADGALTALAVAKERLPGTPLDPDTEERLRKAVQQPRRVDTAVVDSLAVTLAAQRRLEDAIGSVPLVEPITTHLAVIEDLVRDARGPLRPRVLDVAAQWAQFCGWLHTANGRLAPARAWFDRASEWALEAGDRNMVATALSFKGHVAWLAGHVGPVIGLSQAAQRDRSVYVGQLTYDALQEARGHALAGDRAAAERKIGEAGELAARTAEYDGEVPPWQYYRLPAFFALEQGLVYRYLGQEDPASNQRAVDLLTAGLTGLPDEMRGAEWTGDYRCQLVLAHIQADEPEQATAAAAEAAKIARETNSPRLIAQLQRLHARLAATWPTLPAVTDLGEHLA
ncbi:transcriptional regulator [Carbonactinospora thermoautotrophica]|uniref:helix-turn-helix domain-containing protein n=1 Tax=Carbonactinospora thermoautotrophica TaxID=1469144 RepID=UPI00226DE86F|nr:helix-turn-helix transcriptional regulator [Carbonactinospora thermoautotrophica]MCX9192643.1 transcriptional regulator [Carbonactinospora thermoautotrophica]